MDCTDILSIFVDLTNGPAKEKFEGLCVTNKGEVWVNNDNDGVDDNSGENVLAMIGMVDLPGPETDTPAGTPTDEPAGTPTDEPAGTPGAPTAAPAPSAGNNQFFGWTSALVTVVAALLQ